MFDIGWGELVVIGIVALIVIGPRELPKTLRTLGQMMTKVRRMAAEFQGQFNEAIREAELDELRKEAEKLSGSMTNPLGALDDPLEKVKSEIRAAVEAPEPEKKPEPAAPAPASAGETAAALQAPEPKPEETPAGPASESGGRAA